MSELLEWNRFSLLGYFSASATNVFAFLLDARFSTHGLDVVCVYY